MVLKFEKWLMAQQSRQDEVGDLARAHGMQNGAKKAVAGRKPDEHKIWTEIVIKSARSSHIAVFNDAWQEFLLAKKATEEFLD